MKNVICLTLMLAILVLCAGCNGTTHFAYTYTLDNGSSLKVRLDTSEGHEIKAGPPFEISYEETTLTHGMFKQGNLYQDYISVVEDTPTATLLDSGMKDGHQYIFWHLQGESHDEYNYAILLEGGEICILLANAVSEESAKEVFSRLSFTLE